MRAGVKILLCALIALFTGLVLMPFRAMSGNFQYVVGASNEHISCRLVGEKRFDCTNWLVVFHDGFIFGNERINIIMDSIYTPCPATYIVPQKCICKIFLGERQRVYPYSKPSNFKFVFDGLTREKANFTIVGLDQPGCKNSFYYLPESGNHAQSNKGGGGICKITKTAFDLPKDVEVQVGKFMYASTGNHSILGTNNFAGSIEELMIGVQCSTIGGKVGRVSPCKEYKKCSMRDLTRTRLREIKPKYYRYQKRSPSMDGESLDAWGWFTAVMDQVDVDISEDAKNWFHLINSNGRCWNGFPSAEIVYPD